MFDVVLQRSESENNALNKTITTISTISGTLKDNCDLIDPFILVEGDISILKDVNYCTIDSFGRKYFINSIESVRNNLVLLKCHVDVLSSFASEIRQNKGIVRRSESVGVYNLYLNDGSMVSYQDPYILTEPFPGGFDGTCYILSIAGSGGVV